MGMTIEKAIDIMENYEEYGFLSQENGRNKAINIMHKYQKIKQIAESLKTLTIDEMSNVEMQIREVLEDGNVD